MTRLAFSKMHGAGNDFVIVEASAESELSGDLARRLSDRHRGVGCDQLMVILPSTRGDCAFRYLVYNADGSVAEQCGNGARCVAAWLARREHLAIPFSLQSPSGRVEVTLQDGQFAVGLGVPEFTPSRIPFTRAAAANYRFNVLNECLLLSVLGLGNPHAVLQVENVQSVAVGALGPALERHPDFPERVNVGFSQLIDRQTIALRVWERGAGETLACGSGACAAVVAGICMGALEPKVRVRLPGGELCVQWLGSSSPVTLSGPVAFVYEGVWQA